ncbi:MAG TPA: MaoC/PaaZ C-terminal domain-containing protein [Mycobacteriales bacterium]|nr:MaoC/PaaZ C-terminal domain-containing protein [Mycobacteriales bacterium]
MALRQQQVGVWTETFPFEIEAEAVAAFADATNDDLTEHRDGTWAPPSYAWAAQWKSGLGAVIGEGVVDLTADEVSRQLHGEHDLHVHRPMRVGTTVTLRGRTLGVFEKASGTTFTTEAVMVDEDGEVLNTQYATGFFPGVHVGSAGSAPPPRPPAPTEPSPHETCQVVQAVDLDQPLRYALASGDHNLVHLDRAAALSAGHPGVLAHGMCVFGMLTHAAISELGGKNPRSLRRLAVRFARPVYPGQSLTTTFHRGTDGAHFMTANETGEAVIVNGYAELRRLSWRERARRG